MNANAKANRPLSPHLQVYRPQLTSILSITHRITGMVLAFGMLILTCWLATAALGAHSYDQFRDLLFGHIIGQVFLIIWTWSLSYHFCNGIRHLIWDMGKNLSISAVYRSGWMALLASVLLTFYLWLAPLVALFAMGGTS